MNNTENDFRQWIITAENNGIVNGEYRAWEVVKFIVNNPDVAARVFVGGPDYFDLVKDTVNFIDVQTAIRLYQAYMENNDITKEELAAIEKEEEKKAEKVRLDNIEFLRESGVEDPEKAQEDIENTESTIERWQKICKYVGLMQE